ncbi:hypothetical protein, partial [Humitalea rosea]|uniref:hypothetical protein n=1 Tax=Humitalea rosea TaxID=990373 RepID=UPI001B85B96D
MGKRDFVPARLPGPGHLAQSGFRSLALTSAALACCFVAFSESSGDSTRLENALAVCRIHFAFLICQTAVMATFVSYNRDQAFLLPPDLKAWLP